MTEQAKDDELMRRISDALDAEGGLDADPALRAQLDEDPAALSYAQDLVRIDEVLKGFGAQSFDAQSFGAQSFGAQSFGAQQSEPDWEAMASAIERRLDEALPPLEVEAPPRFDDDASAPVSPLDVSRKVAVVSDPPERRSAEVVDLAARRSRRNSVLAWMSGFAAAAAVGLVVSSGMVTFDGASPEAAAIAAEAEAAEEVASPPMAAPVPSAEGRAGGGPVEEARAQRDAPAVAELEPASANAALMAPGEVGVDSAERGAAARFGRGGELDNGERRARPALRRARRLAPSPAPAQARSAGPLGGLDRIEEPRPSRAEVLTSLRPAEPAVQRCLASVGEVARVALRVGAAGEIVGVTVSPPYGAADQRCIESALRAVRLAPSPEGYTVRHAFRPASMAGGARSAAPAESSAAPAAEPPAGP